MAEAVGLAASIVGISAFAAQIASSVIKLKSYLDQVKDAPDDIAILVEEIEEIYLILSDIEEDQHRNAYPGMRMDNSSASRCVDRCKRGVERLQRVVDSMATDFESLNPIKRKWKASKIIWKRDKVEKYKAELAGAVRLLTLSHQIYTRSLIQQQPDIIISRIAQLVQIEPAKDTDIGVTESSCTAQDEESSSHVIRADYGTMVPKSKQKRTQPPWLRWKLCSMLLGRAWDLEICRSQQGWNASISVYACVSKHSLVARYAWSGDVKGLQELFSRGEASPLTLCVYDLGDEMTLLEIGAFCGFFEVCEFLIDQGADAGHRMTGTEHWNAIETFGAVAVSHHRQWGNSDDNRYDQLARLLASKSEIRDTELVYYRGSDSTFSALLKGLDTPLDEWPMEKRHQLASNFTHEAYYKTPELFRIAIGSDLIPLAAIKKHAEVGELTLLHGVAGAIAELTVYHPLFGRHGYLDFRQSCLLGWKSIAQELIAAGADLHATCVYADVLYARSPWNQWSRPQTPLLYVLSYGHYKRDHWGLFANHGPDQAMRAWISVLHESGVDLVEYGRKESLAWVDGPLIMNSVGMVGNPYYWNCHFGQRRVLGLAYGPRPEDWRTWVNEHTDEFAGDFWSIIEKRVEVMPGSWIE